MQSRPSQAGLAHRCAQGLSGLQRVLLLLAGILCLPAWGSTFELDFSQQMEYVEVTGKDTLAGKRSSQDWEQGRVFEYHLPDTAYYTYCDPRGHTLRWKKRTNDGRTDFQALREGDRLLLKGNREGKPLSRTLNLDSSPWYQNLDICLARFILSAEQETRFWVLNPDELTVYRMVARKGARETLDLPIGKTETLKVRITLDDYRSRFWGADHWYRVSDGLGVRSRSKRGVTRPPTEVLLVRESSP